MAYGATNLVTNGDFEASPFDSGWNSDFTTTTGFAPGSTTAAASASGDMFQLTGSGQATGTVGMWVEPTSLVAGQRTFNLVVGTTIGTSAINIRMFPSSATEFQLEYFIGGGTWNVATGSAGDFTVGNAYYLELAFNDLGTAGANYDLAWSGANPGSATTSESQTGITQFQNTAQATNAGATVERLRFVRGAAHGDYNLDDVTLFAPVPEPSTALLGGVALLGFLRRRRAS